MAGGRRRPRKGDRRIDAAIDHFKPMGYAEADIRSTVDQLLEVYGQHGWIFLEEDAYRVVQEALFENEEQQDQQPLLLLEQEEKQLQQKQPQEQEEHLQLLHEEETQQKEAAMHETQIENDMPIVEVHNEIPAEAQLAVDGVDPMLIDLQIENDMPIVEVHNEIPVEAQLAVDGVDPTLIDLPAPEATMLHPAATGTHRTRRPCYGWISESESDSDNEEQPASQQYEVHVPSRGGGLLCTRKRLSRWDVK